MNKIHLAVTSHVVRLQPPSTTCMTTVTRKGLWSAKNSLYNNRIVAFAALFMLGVVALVISSLTNHNFLGASATARFGTSSNSVMAFSLLVKLKFTAEEHKATFLSDIAPLAQYIKEHELDTIAYEVLLSDKDPLQVLVLERYKDKENAFVAVHRSSKLFLEFRPKLQALEKAGFVTIEGDSYLDSGVGFGDRVG